ncbi:PepSY domain-containing protein [Virgibacillus sp. MSJ-26]|uniref:PepSY domain-containing protein n=1 Tax=Virgibacillus sp. MSJ-26 TaxID=2841522 RepID=UPI001C10A6F8|nr:PepSY domain-containing protein [Virgibacillus sp. MSJ-26]MBU5468338.1 PepSY domain-containing protein [Virgibacillus sp. MSJ-26]
MNNKQWQPPHTGEFPHPQANQQVQFCRDCGRYHPMPQPNFQGPHPPEQQFNVQQTELGWNPGQPQFHNQPFSYEQQLTEANRQIDIIEAINIALDQVPGEVVEAERKRKHGTMIYEVEIVNEQGVKYEVEIDRNTGNVISVELD